MYQTLYRNVDPLHFLLTGSRCSSASRKPLCRPRRSLPLDRKWQPRSRCGDWDPFSQENLMCGIIGIVSRERVALRLLEGLRRLEYRGYDSAGIATLVNGRIERRRAKGKLDHLVIRLEDEPVDGAIGIGHTRWATHGLPTETNAHPIATDRVAVVHNGIIEN